MKDIYILHEYGADSHFKALIDECEKYGYRVRSSIILSHKSIVMDVLRMIIRERKIIQAIIYFLRHEYRHFTVHFLKGKVLIVGIAPYNNLMNRYAKLFKRNKSFYFTSWDYWGTDKFAKGKLNNRQNFEAILTDNFLGAFCVSERTQDGIGKIVANTSVVRHSIDVKSYKRHPDQIGKTKKYIFMGVFNDRKNIPLLIDWIKKSRASFEFSFAGYGHYRAELVNLAREDKRVKYLGKLTKSQIKATLANYDFLVLPSKQEPYGIVLLEALAAGVPCIVSNAVGPSEIIDESTGLSFELDDNYQKEFANFEAAISRSLEMESAEYLQLHQNALKQSREYAPEELIKAWLILLEKHEY